MPRDGRASAPTVTPRTIAAEAAMAAMLVRNMEPSNLAGLTYADSWLRKGGKWFNERAMCFTNRDCRDKSDNDKEKRREDIMPLPLLPTSLVGSYAQSDWLIDRKKLAGRFPPRVRAKELWRGGAGGPPPAAGGAPPPPPRAPRPPP